MQRHNLLPTWSSIGAICFLAATTCHSTALEEYRKYMRVKGIEELPETQTLPLSKPSVSYRQALSDSGVWTIPFAAKGIFGTVYAMDVLDGRIAVGGGIRGADGIAVDGIAIWDGMQWTSVPKGLGGVGGIAPIRRIRLSVEGLHALGDPGNLTLDGQSVDAVHWDGSKWAGWKLDTGMVAYDIIHWNNQTLLATSSGIWEAGDSGLRKIASNLNGKAVLFETKGDQLWVAGDFRLEPDTMRVNYAYWTGSAWTGLLPRGPQPARSYSPPIDFTWHGEDLFAIEAYTEMGKSGLDWSIMRWNGSNWTDLSTDPDISLYAAIESNQERLYLTSLKREVASLEKWDGNRFQVEAAFQGNFVRPILKLDAKRLYLAGSFKGVDSVRADGVAMLDGSRWMPLSKSNNPGPSFGQGLGGFPTLATDGRSLYFGSGFLYFSGEKPAGGLSAWDGQSFDNLGGGLKTSRGSQLLDMHANAFAFQEGKVYVGGSFDSAGAMGARNIAAWDGSSWQSLGAGYPGTVYDMLLFGNNLIVGGSPDYELQPGSNTAIARHALVYWNGSGWQSFGAQITGQVRKIFTYQGELHIGGYFMLPDESRNCALARRSGESWIPIIYEAKQHNTQVIHSAVVHDGDLYVAGIFRDTANEEFHGLVKWNGSTLSRFDSVKSIGVGGQALLSYQSKLFFASSLKGRNDRLISWDGKQWHTVLDNSIPYVLALMEFGGDMYVYGDIPYFNGKCAYNLIRWGSPNSNRTLPYIQANPGAGHQLLFQGGAPGFITKHNGRNFDLRGRVVTLEDFFR